MSAADREAAALRLCNSLESLMALVLTETRLLKAGRLREGMQIQTAKEDAARTYQEALRALAGASPAHGPVRSRLLAQGRDFDAVLAENLAVLATVRSVSESILRDLSQKLGDRRPITYGPARREATTAPLTLSRST